MRPKDEGSINKRDLSKINKKQSVYYKEFPKLGLMKFVRQYLIRDYNDV